MGKGEKEEIEGGLLTSAFGEDVSSEDVEGGNVRRRVEASSEEGDELDGMVGESG